MPLYEYLCEACGKLSEVVQKFSDAPLTDCELCGAKGKLAKQISRTNFALKGTGWYSTDYKPKSETKTEAAPAAPAKTETKPSSG